MEAAGTENARNKVETEEAFACNNCVADERDDGKSKEKRIVFLFSAKDALETLNGLKLVGNKEINDVGPTVQSVTTEGETSEAFTAFPCVTNMSCSTCAVSFDSRSDYIDHVKGDFHRFNVRAKLRGSAAVSEEKFEEMTGDISSISGSDSEGSDDSGDRSSPRPNAPVCFPDADDEFMNACSRQLKIFLRNGKGEVISIHRCLIFGKKSRLNSSADVLRAVESLPSSQKCAIFMVGGGHFAGAVFDGEKVLQHKTFHRYVVRAKRGSVQSQCDKQGNAPRSAGATLRRYNEAALTKEIQDLLASWSADLKDCAKIFIRAPGFNGAIFFGGKTPVFDKSEKRIYPISIHTRRPTFHELKRVHKTLFSVEVFGPDYPISECISPKKVQNTVLESVDTSISSEDRSKEKQSTENPSHLTDTMSTTAEIQIDCSSDECSGPEDEVLVWSTVSFDTSELKEFENPRRQPRRKKKTGEANKIRKKEENVQLNGEQFEIRNRLFTACKTGDVADFQSSFEDLERSLRNEIEGIETINYKLTHSSLGSLDQGSEQVEGHGDLEANLSKETPSEIGQEFEQHLSKFLNLRFGPQSTTLLHVATRSGSKQIMALLMTAGADPAVRDAQNQVPFLAATTKDAKNEFRRFMAQNPTKYDYVKAQIPGPLTEEMENERKAKANEKKKIQKKAKKEKLKETQLEDEKKRTEEEARLAFLAMSDREKRAFAAEQRFKAQLERENSSKSSSTSRCWECGCDLTGKVPFEYYDFKFCSPTCLREHRHKNSS